MFFDKIRRIAAWTGIPAALALAAPIGTASAATHAGPTALTITPAFADTVGAGSNTAARTTSGEFDVAQNRKRRPRAAARRGAPNRSAQRRRAVNRNAVRNRQTVRNRETRRVARRTARRTANRVDNRRWRRRVYHRGRWWNYRNGYYYDNAGVAIAAGVLGLAAGALVGSAYANDNDDVVIVDDGYGGVPAPYTSEWYRRCDIKYRSFRASDGTYLGYDGVRHNCRLP